MSKPSAADTAGGVSLFPFLAVLLCTMGALIVVLVVLSRQVQYEIAVVHEPPAPLSGELSPAEARELAQLELDQLRQQRAATEADLAEARAKLGHLEEHSRQLQSQVLALQDAARGLASSAGDPAEAESLSRRQAELDRERQELESQLDQARQAGPAAKTYAIIPYEGASGTKRRPIYIECRADQVVIQPEGIVFTEQDFSGALGPGNPLASAVRAVREYWIVANPAAASGDEQPYPLLVVRASGIRAYYVARAALRSWDEEFGYELVDDDWKLEYPSADPQLAKLAGEAAGEARQREALAAASAPRLRANRTRTVIGASPTGRGMVRQEVPEEGGAGGFSGSGWDGNGGGSPWARADRSPSWVEESVPSGDVGDLPYASVEVPPSGGGSGTGHSALAGTNGSGVGSDGSGSDVAGDLGTNGGGTGDSFLGGGSTTGNEALVGNGAEGATSQPDWSTGNVGASPGFEAGGPNSLTPGAGLPGNDGPTAGDGTSADGSPTNLATGAGTSTPVGSESSGAGSAAGTPGDVAAGSAAAGESSFLTGQRPGGPDGPQGASGSGGATPARMGGAARGSSAGAGAANTAGGPSGAAGAGETSAPNPQGMPSLSFSASPPPDASAQPLSGERGTNWGVPAAEAHNWPISRPLRLECYGNRLVLSPAAGRPRSGKVIELPGPTRDGIDPLVQSIWTQMQSWGMAGQGMYWKPVLSCTVAPDGEGRFADLAVLLADSGLEIRRREEPQTRLATPPTRAPR